MKPNNGTVEIHGRIYETVALRVQKFREKHPSHTLKTVIVRLDQEEVLIEAQILDEQGRLIANGHAQEFRQSSQINRTSYVENCETSAIGRALAAFGLGGSEFATADELANAINNKKGPSITPTSGYWDAMPVDVQNEMLDTAHRVSTLIKKKDIKGAVAELTEAVAKFDGREDYMAAQWTCFESQERRALKDGGFHFATKEKEAA